MAAMFISASATYFIVKRNLPFTQFDTAGFTLRAAELTSQFSSNIRETLKGISSYEFIQILFNSEHELFPGSKLTVGEVKSLYKKYCSDNKAIDYLSLIEQFHVSDKLTILGVKSESEFLEKTISLLGESEEEAFYFQGQKTAMEIKENIATFIGSQLKEQMLVTTDMVSEFAKPMANDIVENHKRANDFVDVLKTGAGYAASGFSAVSNSFAFFSAGYAHDKKHPGRKNSYVAEIGCSMITGGSIAFTENRLILSFNNMVDWFIGKLSGNVMGGFFGYSAFGGVAANVVLPALTSFCVQFLIRELDPYARLSIEENPERNHTRRM